MNKIEIAMSCEGKKMQRINGARGGSGIHYRKSMRARNILLQTLFEQPRTCTRAYLTLNVCVGMRERQASERARRQTYIQSDRIYSRSARAYSGKFD